MCVALLLCHRQLFFILTSCRNHCIFFKSVSICMCCLFRFVNQTSSEICFEFRSNVRLFRDSYKPVINSRQCRMPHMKCPRRNGNGPHVRNTHVNCVIQICWHNTGRWLLRRSFCHEPLGSCRAGSGIASSLLGKGTCAQNVIAWMHQHSDWVQAGQNKGMTWPIWETSTKTMLNSSILRSNDPHFMVSALLPISLSLGGSSMIAAEAGVSNSAAAFCWRYKCH